MKPETIDFIRPILFWLVRIAIMALGVFFVIAGEFDDSPGLQGLGLLIIVGVIKNILGPLRR